MKTAIGQSSKPNYIILRKGRFVKMKRYFNLIKKISEPGIELEIGLVADIYVVDVIQFYMYPKFKIFIPSCVMSLDTILAAYMEYIPLAYQGKIEGVDIQYLGRRMEAKECEELFNRYSAYRNFNMENYLSTLKKKLNMILPGYIKICDLDLNKCDFNVKGELHFFHTFLDCIYKNALIDMIDDYLHDNRVLTREIGEYKICEGIKSNLVISDDYLSIEFGNKIKIPSTEVNLTKLMLSVINGADINATIYYRGAKYTPDDIHVIQRKYQDPNWVRHA